MRVGVLALQGSFAEHVSVLRNLGTQAIEVRLPGQLEGLAGLVIPGGESTTIGKLAASYGFLEPLRRFAGEKAVMGTCAGMVFMAADIGREQPILGVMDIAVARNAFGRQVDSFESAVRVSAFDNGEPFPGIFIRAPKLLRVWGRAETIALLPDGTAVAARQGRLLATAFHPELAGDPRFHRLFLDLVYGKGS